ncbi:ribosomal-protein-serine acetyltransferase [Curtobacterium sp. PhB130]|nr:ribosomal-protein-serine acetyltransferase [Curtobacterium sp. ZW137]ROS77669.1 ribosomal-protein-serine acetyltransferase [Curtobacterium sp. PhB130]
MHSVGPVTAFGRDLGDGCTLTLRDLSTVEAVHDLVLANLDRLRAAEPWAWGSQTLEDTSLHTERMLAQYAMDRSLPCVIRVDDRVVGAASLAFDTYLGQASLGYWIDAGQEGRGIVRRAASVLVSVAGARGARRVEIRTAVGNERSRGLAERLGFTHEGTLRSALPLGPARVDVALYGRVL